MPEYILPDQFVEKLRRLRYDYEKITHISLDSTAPYHFSTLFGAKDIKARQNQIQFITDWLSIFDPWLENSIDIDNHINANYILALRVLVSLTLFIKSLVSTNSVLKYLLNEALGVKHNTLDKKTKICCLITAQSFLNDLLENDNAQLTIKKPLDKKISEKFNDYINKLCKSLDPATSKKYSMTSITVPMFSKPLELSGYAVGYVLGGALSQSSALVPLHNKTLRAFSSGAMIVLGATTNLQIGLLLVGPTLVGRLIDTFCGVTMSYLLGKAMGLLGASVGWGVGMGLKVAWDLLCKACSLVQDLYCDYTHQANLTGFTLVEPERIVEGVPFKSINTEEMNTYPVYLNILPEGVSLKVGEQTEAEFIPWDGDMPEIFNFPVPEKDIELQQLRA